MADITCVADEFFKRALRRKETYVRLSHPSLDRINWIMMLFPGKWSPTCWWIGGGCFMLEMSLATYCFGMYVYMSESWIAICLHAWRRYVRTLALGRMHVTLHVTLGWMPLREHVEL